MDEKASSSHFQQVIEAVETLPLDDQALLIDIVQQRLVQERRRQLAAEIRESRAAYLQGDVQRGTVDDLLKETAS